MNKKDVLKEWFVMQKTDDKIHALKFESDTPFTLRVEERGWNGKMEYSTNGVVWSEWVGTTPTPKSSVLYLRGVGNSVVGGAILSKAFVFSESSNLNAIGNIEYLLDWETVKRGEHPTMGVNCYRFLFRDCTSLTQAPELPATTIKGACYLRMFANCTSLTQAPELPATTLGTYCYTEMFRGCTSLTQAPELPATTIARDCYQAMFKFCSALKFSQTQGGEYAKEWRIPSRGVIGEEAVRWNGDMLLGTGGTFVGNPQINTTYYTTEQ